MNSSDKPLVWMHGEIKTLPFSRLAKLETGKTGKTPKAVIEICKQRLREYDNG